MDQHSPHHDVKTEDLPPAKRLSRGSQIILLLFIGALVVAGFVLGPSTLKSILGIPAGEKAEEAAEAPGDGKSFKPTDQQWATLKLKTVEDRVFQAAAVTDGKIAIDDDLVTPVFSPYTGRVTRLIARPGDDVGRGDPLFAMEAGELAQGQNDLISAQATLKTAKAQLALSETNEKRQHALYLAQGAALKDWQQSQVDLATAQGGMNSAAIALAAVRNRLRILGKSDSDIAAIEATPDLLRLEAETMVRAPIAGTVTQRQVGLGQNIVSASSGGSTAVYMIGNLSKVWLIANAREEDSPLIHKGDAAEVSVLAFPGRVFNARITYVAASIDPNTHRLPVRAEVENPNGELKPEMLAGFRIVTGADAMAPAVPSNALVYEGTEAHVWIADPKAKTLEIRPVKVGLLKAGMAAITDGVKAGESVVASGAVFIDRAASGD
jgi:cobalt-zinc-cadmium efflux system membrane fusion protein